jgi:ASC-1-like (ASCH) protein/glutaredoxin
MSTDARIRALTDAHSLVVFSSSWCPNCQQVLKALKEAKLNPHVIEVDSKWKKALTQTFGQYQLQPAVVPSVWIGDKYIGACNDGPERWMGTLPNLAKGKVQGWIKAVEKERKSTRGRKRAKYREDAATKAHAESAFYEEATADELMEMANGRGAGKLQATGVAFLQAYAESLEMPQVDFKALLKRKANRGEQLHRMWWRNLEAGQVEELEALKLCNRADLQAHNTRLMQMFEDVEGDTNPTRKIASAAGSESGANTAKKVMKIKVRRRKRERAGDEDCSKDSLAEDTASMWAGVLDASAGVLETSPADTSAKKPPLLQRKCIEEPWLGWIVNGPKRYEGRLKRGFWARIKEGDEFIAFSKSREVLLRVGAVKEYPDFAEAWGDLGEALIPKCKSKESAMAMYTKFNSVKDILKSGVVAVEVLPAE